ncbi:uncharacterized protein LOC104440828 [Eucalyptus grandis]|uniref:uncharacterized protein LOC104440828 n=1 Tax=Eucalyptus grandis TaxID=71139 RepID=UPI00192EBEB5|nr:uncharacterized protein LOC104440828 [Eucalyptus grandis]
MQTMNSLLCSSTALSPPPATAAAAAAQSFFPLGPSRAAHVRNRLHQAAAPPARVRLSPRRSRVQPPQVASPLQSTVIQETVETSTTESGLVEIGYISSVHGLQGEVCIKSTTDFPELRFSRTGKRWLKQQVLGRETIQEVELVEGRGHPGQKGWMLKFEGIDDVDQAKKLVGAALLVREEDRPELEEGEFYTRDLVGMRVLLKESGEPIGTVVNVYNSGANDLLYVMLDSSTRSSDHVGKSKPTETGATNHFVWVPFVEAIVPHVDMDRGEMMIAPPKGLLELNLRSHDKSKKERRQLEWKERKKFQKRLIAAKKKLCELGQQHVFHGFRYGDKTHTSLLSDQIIGVNSKLLQQALQSIDLSSQRWSDDATRTGIYDALTTSENYLTPLARMDKQCVNSVFEEKGIHLISKGKVATVLVVTDSAEEASNPAVLSESLIQTLECTNQKLVKVEDRASMPLLIICPAGEIPSFQALFSENDHFGFDSEKIWFFEEQMLPVVSCPDEQKSHKILMKSPWEMLQSPIGSGGIISVISSEGIADNLGEIGVDYIQICSPNRRFLDTRTLLLGYVHSREADMGIQVLEDELFSEESPDMILSMSFLKKLMTETDKLQFKATSKPNAHVELVDKEWVDVVPSSPNSCEIRCSLLFSCLNICSLDKVCLLEIPE